MNKKILVALPEYSKLDQLKSSLRDLELEAQLTNSFADLLQSSSSEFFDVILLSNSLFKNDDEESLRELRESFFNQSTPFIMLSDDRVETQVQDRFSPLFVLRNDIDLIPLTKVINSVIEDEEIAEEHSFTTESEVVENQDGIENDDSVEDIIDDLLANENDEADGEKKSQDQTINFIVPFVDAVKSVMNTRFAINDVNSNSPQISLSSKTIKGKLSCTFTLVSAELLGNLSIIFSQEFFESMVKQAVLKNVASESDPQGQICEKIALRLFDEIHKLLAKKKITFHKTRPVVILGNEHCIINEEGGLNFFVNFESEKGSFYLQLYLVKQ